MGKTRYLATQYIMNNPYVKTIADYEKLCLYIFHAKQCCFIDITEQCYFNGVLVSHAHTLWFL